MKNKMVLLSMVLGISGLFMSACASNTIPMTRNELSKYRISAARPDSLDTLKAFQYYVSRDIVLIYDPDSDPLTPEQLQTTRGVAEYRIHRDYIQIVSSTPGVALQVRQNEDGQIMLGVAFESSDEDLLWFVQNPAKGNYFYLSYTDEVTGKIMYGGNPYDVSYEEAAGLGASMRRMSPKAQGEYDHMEPVLLFVEKVIETEQRRTAAGRRL